MNSDPILTCAPAKYTMKTPLTLLIVLGIVIVSGCASSTPRAEQEQARNLTDERLGEAMQNIRELAIAIESFAIENNRYPVPEWASHSVGRFRLARISSIQNDIRGYAREMLVWTDPWQNDYLYWSSGKAYVIVCVGADGVITDKEILEEVIRWAERDEELAAPLMTNVSQELLFYNGQFSRYPLFALGP